jgi:predicted transcriptional regulator
MRTGIIVQLNTLYYSAFWPIGALYMSVTTVRLQPDVETGLDTMAEKLQRSKSWLINQALKEFIDRQELEQVRWKETLKAMDSVAQGKVFAGSEVHEWLRSWGTDKELNPPKVKP